MRQRNYLFLIFIMLGLHVFLNYHTLRNSSLLRTDDEGGVIANGLSYYHAVLASHSKVSWNDRIDYALALYANCHPHLVDFMGALSWKILYSLKALDIDLMILMTNSLFLLILLSSVYGIGSTLFNRNTGLLSAALVSMFPVVFGHSRMAMLDFPLMCMISLGFYLLLKTRGFSSTPYSLLSGIAFGLSQATKEAAFIFILGPLIFFTIKYGATNNKIRRWLNFAITATCFSAISAIIYLRPQNLQAFKVFFGKTAYCPNYTDPLYYLSNLIEMIGPLVLFVTLPLLAHYLINIKRRDKFLFVWFIAPILLFSISSNKNIRFFLPALPAFALIVSGEVDKINLSNGFKKTLYILLILTSITQYSFFNTGILDTKLKGHYLQMGILRAKKDKYLTDSMKLLEVFNEEAKSNAGANKIIIFLFNMREIGWPLWLNVFLHQMPFVVKDLLLQDEAQIVNTYGADWSKEILTADYIIERTGAKPEPNFAGHILNGLESGFVKHRNQFKLIAQIKTSFNDSTVCVYKKLDNH